MSTAYHPQMDGQVERTIQTLEDILWVCVIDYGDNWVEHLPLVEFAYNNNYHSSIGMAYFETLYGRRCRSSIGWFELGEDDMFGPNLFYQSMEKVKVIQDTLKVSQSSRKSYADVRHRDLEFEVMD